jgi:hypothetical protein
MNGQTTMDIFDRRQPSEAPAAEPVEYVTKDELKAAIAAAIKPAKEAAGK